MEITEVETHLVQSDAALEGYGLSGWLIVRIHTDTGLTGIGEAGTWGFLEAAETAVQTFARSLVGKDPRRRDHHWQYCYRNAHFRGAALMGAISAIDVALWDLTGKHYGAPIHDLLGGQSRDRLRAYVHAFGETTDELVERCAQAREQGFTGVGHLSPLLDESREERYFETHAELVERARENVRRYREAVGTDVDLCIEMHRRLDPAEAVVVARELEAFDPLFYEDPVRPDNLDAMAEVAAKTSLPIATGERLHTPEEFSMLLERNAVDFVRPNLGLAGGITGVKKIAALAEANYVDVVPHNPLGPVSTAACAQLCAAIPNFGILEYPYQPDLGRAPSRDLLVDPIEHEEGMVLVPEGPGLGIDLDEDELERWEARYEPREFTTRLHRDGSVVDQ